MTFDYILLIVILATGNSLKSTCRTFKESDFRNHSDIQPSKKGYYNSNVFNSCNISYIDPESISSNISNTMWIAFVGDSRIRSPFLFLASQLSGNAQSLDSENYHLGDRYFNKITDGKK